MTDVLRNLNLMLPVLLVRGFLSLAAVAIATPSAAQSRSTPRVALYPCTISGLYAAECGYLEVPENRARRGQVLGLRVVRVPALVPARPRHALIVFAGGPGSSATAGAASYLEQFADIRQTHDIIAMDQRGTGESNPLMCVFPTARLSTIALLSFAWPDSLVDQCRRDAAEKGDLSQYTTTASVADYEDLRLALGLEKVDIYGASYGTRAAQEYARRYPGAVRTLTLRAILPPSGVLFRDAGKSIQRSLERVYAACEADFRCNWSRRKLAQQLDALLLDLNTTPRTIAVRGFRGDLDGSIPFNGDMYVGALRRMLASAELLPQVPNAIDKALKDSFTGVSAGISGTTALERTQSQGLFWNVTCAEDAPRVSEAALRAATADTPLRNEMVAHVLRICARWGAAPVPTDFYEPLRTDAPVLLLSGADDPVTPPAYGEEVLKSLANARHLVFEATSHTPFNHCQQRITAEFIRAARTQPLDTTCMSSLKRPNFFYRRPWWVPFDW